MGIAINILSYPELLYFNLLSFRGGNFQSATMYLFEKCV